MTPQQRTILLASLRRGGSISESLRAAKMSEASYNSAVAEDDDLAEEVERAIAEGEVAFDQRMKEAKEREEAKGQKKDASVTPLVPREVDPFQPRPPIWKPADVVSINSPPKAPAQIKPRAAVNAMQPEDSYTSAHIDRWQACRKQAEEMGPGIYGYLLWVESRCVAAGLDPLDELWLWHFEEFYKSEKMVDVGRFGLRAAKSTSCCRAIVAEVLFIQRRLQVGVVGVCPVIAQKQSEADDRFDSICQILRACGLMDLTGTRQKETEEAPTFTRSGGGSGARVISLRDSQGHPVEFRIYPASISGAAGFTGIAGFCDEVDLWGKEKGANPAKLVLEVLFTRYTTQPEARLHVMSASYNPESEHANMIAKGDTPLQRVARLGERGAQKDTEARAKLAVVIGSTDEELLKPADPNSTDIPCWVSNPVAPIESCYQRTDGNLKRMLQLHGGRIAKGTGAAGMAVDEIKALGEANRRVVAGDRRGLMQFDGLPSWDPRSRGGRGGGQSV